MERDRFRRSYNFQKKKKQTTVHSFLANANRKYRFFGITRQRQYVAMSKSVFLPKEYRKKSAQPECIIVINNILQHQGTS